LNIFVFFENKYDVYVFFTKDRSQQQIAYQEKIVKLQAFSLKAQMNPHFIFNALNGLQSVMILQGEQMANKYLGIFSKLLRFTIEMTNTEMISLEDELGYLSAYVELQKMRMQSAIEYNVVVDQKDEEYICNLVGEKNITLSLNQKEHLFSHISFFSNQFIQ